MSIRPEFMNLKVQMLSGAIGHKRPLLPIWPEIGAAVGENTKAAVIGIKSNEEALVSSDQDIAEIMSSFGIGAEIGAYKFFKPSLKNRFVLRLRTARGHRSRSE